MRWLRTYRKILYHHPIFRLKVFGMEIFRGKRRDRVEKSRLNGDPMKKSTGRFSAIRAKSPLINREVDNSRKTRIDS